MGLKKSGAGTMGKLKPAHGNTSKASSATGRSKTGKGVRKPEVK